MVFHEFPESFDIVTVDELAYLMTMRYIPSEETPRRYPQTAPGLSDQLLPESVET